MSDKDLRLKFILVGASGTGKTTMAGILEEQFGLKRCVTSTTRPPREGEKNGVSYHFRTKLDPEEMFEHASFGGFEYGITKAELTRGDFIILDPKGVEFYRKHYPEPLIVIQLFREGVQVDEERMARDKAAGFDNVNPDFTVHGETIPEMSANLIDVVRDIIPQLFVKQEELTMSKMKESPVCGITYIDEQPWLVTLPDGGNTRGESTKSEYAKMFASAGKEAFHCKMASWCSNQASETRWDKEGEGYFWHESGFVCQFDGSKENWDLNEKDYRGTGTGFRPVLIPLDPETLQPDPGRLSSMKDGSTIRMGTLYMGGSALVNPTNPIGCGQPAYGMFGPPLGNTPEYVIGSNLEIKDTHSDPSKQINFIKFGDRLVSDRVILGCVSINDLESNLKLKDFVSAKENEKEPEEPINLWARLGVSTTVTPEEFEILRGEESAAQDLLIQLIQSGRCSMCGDTYFPEPANEEFLEEDLNFDLPVRPLQPGPKERERDTNPTSFEARLSDANSRVSSQAAGNSEKAQGPQH